MTINELIQELTAAVEKHGDMPIYDTDAHEIIGIAFEEETAPTRAYIEASF